MFKAGFNKILVASIAMLLVINSAKAQYWAEEVVDINNVENWIANEIKSYNGVYRFGWSEMEIELVVSFNDTTNYVIKKSHKYRNEKDPFHPTFVHLTNVRIVDNKLYSDQINGRFVTYTYGDRETKSTQNGLLLDEDLSGSSVGESDALGGEFGDRISKTAPQMAIKAAVNETSIKKAFGKWKSNQLKNGFYVSSSKCKYPVDGFGISDEIEYIYGDLNDDGIVDALAMFYSNACSGGKALTKNIKVLILSNGDKFIADELYFEGVEYQLVDSWSGVTNGWIEVDSIKNSSFYGTWKKYAESDANCCPSIEKIFVMPYNAPKLNLDFKANKNTAPDNYQAKIDETMAGRRKTVDEGQATAERANAQDLQHLYYDIESDQAAAEEDERKETEQKEVTEKPKKKSGFVGVLNVILLVILSIFK